MPLTPWIPGALAAAIIGGAATGMSLDTTPVERFSDPLDTIPRHRAAATERSATFAPQPDHYAMTTPKGTLSVSDVTNRHRQLNPPAWQQASYRSEYAPEPYLLDENGRGIEFSDDYAPEPAPRRAAPALAAAQAPLDPVGKEPLALPEAAPLSGPAAGPAPAIRLASLQAQEPSPKPRVVKVQAELALQP